VDEDGRVARLEAVEQRRDLLARQRGGGEGDPARAGVEQRVDRVGPRRLQSDRSPQLERRAELEDPFVERLDQRLGLLGRQPLDPSAVESETTTRSIPSSIASAARASGSWSIGCSWLGGSPASSRRSAGPSAMSRGGAVRRSSASIRGAGSRCWWMSVGIAPGILEHCLLN
jgi:hypothetical protein